LLLVIDNEKVILKGKWIMGFIYSGLNNVNGFSSRACIGRVDENGYIYNNINNVNGFSSRACIGRVDENGYVYNGINNINGFASRACIGRVDENGYVYNGINNINGFASRACIGRVDENGYVYNGINNVNGFTSRTCIGRVDIDNQWRAAGASLLLCLRPLDMVETGSPVSQSSRGLGISQIAPVELIDSGISVVGTVPSFVGLIVKILMLIFLAVPIIAFLLGFYLPYDVFFGSDQLGFGEYGPIIVFSYGISLIPLGMSFIDTLVTCEYRGIEYLIIIYAIPVVLLFSGCIAEGKVGSAILSFIPAIMLFVFPAIVCLILNGLACLLSEIFCIDDVWNIGEYCFILTLIVSVILSILGGVKLISLADTEVNSINETFGIEARIQEGPSYIPEPVGEGICVVENREVMRFKGVISKDSKYQFHYYTIPKTGNYRFEIDDCSFEVAMSVCDEKGNCLASANHCSNGKGTRVFGLVEGQEISIETHDVGGYTDYSLLVIEDVDISDYASIKDRLMYHNQMNSYSFTPSSDGNYSFEIETEDNIKYDIDFRNHRGQNHQHREECSGKTVLEVYNLVAGKQYILDVIGQGEFDYILNINYLRPNSNETNDEYEEYADNDEKQKSVEAEAFRIERRETAKLEGSTSPENRTNVFYFTVPVSGEYRYEFTDMINEQATLEIYDSNNKLLHRSSYCGNGQSIRGPELYEGDELRIEVHACVGYPSYSLLVIRDSEISGYPAITDHTDYCNQWNVYDFTAPYDGSYRFEFIGNIAPFDIVIIDTPDRVVVEKKECTDGDYIVANNLVAGRKYKVKIVGQRKGDYSLKYNHCGAN